MRTARYVLVPLGTVLGLALALTAVAAIGLGGGRDGAAGPVTAGSDPVVAPSANLTSAIAGLQSHLRAQPRDERGWATLGLGYVEAARTSGNPAYYPKAEAVLARARTLDPRDDLALAGQAALAASRHQFAAALAESEQALAINPFSAQAGMTQVDALVELGRYQQARAAARRADSTQPGLARFARLSYPAELQGDIRSARAPMARALAAAATPDDTAFAQVHLGDLARISGHLTAADQNYDAAQRAVPSYVPAIVGHARVALGRGDAARAVSLLTTAVSRMPLPEYVLLLGETYESQGRAAEARSQYAVLRAAVQLAGRAGVGTDLETALFESDHGDSQLALAAARREWARRHSVHVADALAWALHANNRDSDALPYSAQATRLGTRDGLFWFHRGMIEKSLRLDAAAGMHLRAALRSDPGFSPLHAAEARAALNELGSSQ